MKILISLILILCPCQAAHSYSQDDRTQTPNSEPWEMPRAILPKEKLPADHEYALKLLEELAKLRID